MMVILVLLWGLLHEGIWCLTGPSRVTVGSGDPVMVRCVYNDGFDDYIKYWCKGERAKYCTVLISTETDNKNVSTGRLTIQDTPDTRSFNVTMRNTRPEDSDIYFCGIERNLGDNMHMVTVEVLPGVCRVTAHWTDIVEFPSDFSGIEVNHVVNVTCQEMYEKKNITLKCREESGRFDLSAQSGGDYCVGVCRKAVPWTQIVDFPKNFREIPVDGSVVVSCQQRFQEKKLRLWCKEEAGKFLLSPEDGQGSCIGVCRREPPWTHVVDFPENFIEIAVNGSVDASCQQRFQEKNLRLWCKEQAGEFLLSPEDGQGSCVGKNLTTPTNQLRYLLTSTFGLMVPLVIKLMVLLVILVVKISGMINSRLRIYRKELDLRRSEEEISTNIKEKELNDYIPPPSKALVPSHRKQKREAIPLQQLEEVQELYENLQDQVCK